LRFDGVVVEADALAGELVNARGSMLGFFASGLGLGFMEGSQSRNCPMYGQLAELVAITAKIDCRLKFDTTDCGATTHKQVDQIAVFDVSPDLVRLFLRHLEEDRKCIAATRNQRLAAIRSLARFVGLPEYV
jgi:hypothetical protein